MKYPIYIYGHIICFVCWELALQTVHQLGTSYDKCGSNKPFYSMITHFRSRNTPTTMLDLIYVLSRCYSTIIHHFWLCGSIMQCITISHDHYLDVIMSAMASHITGVSIVGSTICSGADQRKYLGVTGLCEGNPPLTSVFPSQRVRNAANVSIWWRYHDIL